MQRREPNILIGDGPERTAQVGARLITDLARGIATAAGRFTIALSGGHTPELLYRTLAQPPYRDQMPWEQTHFFWSDERCVPPESAESNYKMAYEALLSHVSVPAENIHRALGEIPVPEEIARLYEQELIQFFSLVPGELPSFDLTLLGIGDDGHTASLFPGNPALRETGHMVISTFVEQVKAFRITFSASVINSSATVLFLVNGAQKAEILHKILEAEFNPDLYPAQIVNPRDQLIWLVDGAASSLLIKKPQAAGTS